MRCVSVATAQLARQQDNGNGGVNFLFVIKFIIYNQRTKHASTDTLSFHDLI